jgi:hypothetical protein
VVSHSLPGWAAVSTALLALQAHCVADPEAAELETDVGSYGQRDAAGPGPLRRRYRAGGPRGLPGGTLDEVHKFQ